MTTKLDFKLVFPHVTFGASLKETEHGTTSSSLTEYGVDGSRTLYAVYNGYDTFESALAAIVLDAALREQRIVKEKIERRRQYTERQREFARIVNDDTPDKPSLRQRRRMKQKES